MSMKIKRTAADEDSGNGGQTCSVCGASIERDPEGEEPRTWHHNDGDKHDHEAKPSGGDKESRRTAAGPNYSPGVVDARHEDYYHRQSDPEARHEYSGSHERCHICGFTRNHVIHGKVSSVAAIDYPTDDDDAPPEETVQEGGTASGYAAAGGGMDMPYDPNAQYQEVTGSPGTYYTPERDMTVGTRPRGGARRGLNDTGGGGSSPDDDDPEFDEFGGGEFPDPEQLDADPNLPFEEGGYLAPVADYLNRFRQVPASKRTAADDESSEGGQTCSVCGASIERDPAGEEPRTWHHNDGDKHDHEAKPSGGDKESMRKGAPFADYKDFEDCVSKNSDKDDPEAYCGYIKHKVEDKKSSKVASDDLLSRARSIAEAAGSASITRLSGTDLNALADMASSQDDETVKWARTCASAAGSASVSRFSGTDLKKLIDMAKQSSKRTALSLTNVGIDGPGVGIGTDPNGARVKFRLSDKDESDLKSVLYSDLGMNFSGVEIEQSDIIENTARRRGRLSAKDIAAANRELQRFASRKRALADRWEDLQPGDAIRVGFEESATDGIFVRLEDNSNPDFYGDAKVVVYTPVGGGPERKFVLSSNRGEAEKPRPAKTAEHKTEGPYKVQVAGIGEQVWSENALRFDTPEEAKSYASDLLGRWFGADMARVVPSDTPTRAPVEPGDTAVVINYRTGARRRAMAEIQVHELKTGDILVAADGRIDRHNNRVAKVDGFSGMWVIDFTNGTSTPPLGNGKVSVVRERTAAKYRGDLDRSVAFSVLLDVWPEFGSSPDDGGKTVTAFLDAWYEDPGTDMHAFAKKWVEGKTARKRAVQVDPDYYCPNSPPGGNMCDIGTCPRCDAERDRLNDKQSRKRAVKSRNCENGNHSICTASSCTCSCHAKGTAKDMSGACGEGDHDECKMSHGLGDDDCQCPVCRNKTARRKQAGEVLFDASDGTSWFYTGLVGVPPDEVLPDGSKVFYNAMGGVVLRPNGTLEVYDGPGGADVIAPGLASRRTAARSLSEIAAEIRRDWKNVEYSAAPYLDAMRQLDSINDNYGADSAKGIVAYFLSNSSKWRGETAKRIKAELRAMGSKTASNYYLDMIEDSDGNLVDIEYYHRFCAPDELKAKGDWPAPEFPDYDVYCAGCGELIHSGIDSEAALRTAADEDEAEEGHSVRDPRNPRGLYGGDRNILLQDRALELHDDERRRQLEMEQLERSGARSDYAHWNEDADYMWWQEEGRHAEEESEPDEDEFYDDWSHEGAASPFVRSQGLFGFGDPDKWGPVKWIPGTPIDEAIPVDIWDEEHGKEGALLTRTAYKRYEKDFDGSMYQIWDIHNDEVVFETFSEDTADEELARLRSIEVEYDEERQYEGDVERYFGVPESELKWTESSRRQAMPNPADIGVKVGDFFVHSWGYDQTNIDFYEVTGLTGQSVKVRQVNNDRTPVGGPASYVEKVVPIPGSYKGPEMTKRVKVSGHDGQPYITQPYGWCGLWDGQPRTETSYG